MYTVTLFIWTRKWESQDYINEGEGRMASRSYRQTRIHLISHFLREIRQKMRRVVRIMFIAALLCAVFCIIVSIICYLFGRTNCDALLVADWLFQYGETPKAGSLNDLPPGEQLFWYVLGATYIAVVTGFILESILQPAELVQFARYVVIDTYENCLKIRYWIKLPEHQYLSDCSIDVLFELGNSKHVGSSSKQNSFRFIDPMDTANDLDTYFGVRGVRTTDIPFSMSIFHDSTCTLYEALDRFSNSINDKGESVLRVRVKGQTPSGRSAMYEKCYRPQDILYGYKFVSIRRDDIENFYNANRDNYDFPIPRKDSMPWARLFPEHLSVVTPVYGASEHNEECGDLKTQYGSNHPRDELCLEPGNHVGLFFSVRITLMDIKDSVTDVYNKLARVKQSTGDE